MTNPFNWRGPSQSGIKDAKPATPGKLPPIVLPNSSKYLKPKEQK